MAEEAAEKMHRVDSDEPVDSGEGARRRRDLGKSHVSGPHTPRGDERVGSGARRRAHARAQARRQEVLAVSKAARRGTVTAASHPRGHPDQPQASGGC